MIDSITRITLNLQETNTMVSIRAKRGDTGRKLLIHLSDGSIPYHISDDCYATFTAKKPDGTKINNACTIENNVIEYEFTDQTCTAVGTMKAEIRLYGADDKMITSACFLVNVYDTVFRDGDEVGSETEMNTLDDLILRANAFLNETGKLLRWQGNWDSETEYEANDLVLHEDVLYVAEEAIAAGTAPGSEEVTAWVPIAGMGSGGEVGPQGPQGEKGDPGETPVKGEDYFTDEDKQELVDAVLEELPENNMWEDLPCFDLNELGMPVLTLDGVEYKCECDTSELMAALDRSIVRIRADIDNGEVVFKAEAFFMQTMSVTDGVYQAVVRGPINSKDVFYDFRLLVRPGAVFLSANPGNNMLANIPTFNLSELGMYPVPLDGGTLVYCHDMTALQILLAQGDVLLTLDVEDVNGDVYPAKAIVRADWLSDQNYYQINTIASNFNTVTGKVNYFMLMSANVFADRILVDVSRLDPSGVLYTPQSLTEAQKTQARENLGITASGQTEGTPVIDLGELGFEPGLATQIIDIDSSTAQTLFDKMRKGFVLLKVPVQDGEASATVHFGLCCITEDRDHYFQGMLCYFNGTSWSFFELSMLSGSRLRFMNSGHTPVICNPQTLTEEQKAQARANIGATAVRVDLDGGVLSIE